MNHWTLLLDGPCPGGYNMAVDELLLNQRQQEFSPPSTCLRFYQWSSPTISLGFSQKAARTVNFEFCRTAGIDVVRRITGGKAVLHHQEITYSLVSNDLGFFPESDILGTYAKIARALQTGLAKIGLETEVASGPRVTHKSPRAAAHPSCFAAANHHEILLQGQKLVGSAQRRAGKAFLQHGSILLDYDAALWTRALQGGCGKEGFPQVATLRHHLQRLPETAFLLEKLAAGFAETFQTELEKACLVEELEARARTLGSDKYVAG